MSGERTSRKRQRRVPEDDRTIDNESLQKKKFANALVAFFILMLLGGSANASKIHHAEGGLAGLIGELTGYAFVLLGLFYSTRWTLTLSGHSYKVGRQAFATLWFWESILGMLLALFMLRISVVSSLATFSMWSLSTWAMYRWLKRLRVHEISPAMEVGTNRSPSEGVPLSIVVEHSEIIASPLALNGRRQQVERLITDSAKIAVETSEIKGKKAVVFTAIMALVFIAAVWMSYPDPALVRSLGSAVFLLSATAWGVSKILPDGWLNMSRTVVLAVALSGGLILYVAH